MLLNDKTVRAEQTQEEFEKNVGDVTSDSAQNTQWLARKLENDVFDKN